MTREEHAAWSERQLHEYVAEAVAAGKWPSDEAVDRARAETAELLPEGLDTPGMLFLVAEAPDGAVVGRLWLGLERRARPGRRGSTTSRSSRPAAGRAGAARCWPPVSARSPRAAPPPWG